MAMCPECDGTGIDGSHDAALYYAYCGEISLCPRCDGVGRLQPPVVAHTEGEWPSRKKAT